MPAVLAVGSAYRNTFKNSWAKDLMFSGNLAASAHVIDLEQGGLHDQMYAAHGSVGRNLARWPGRRC